MLWEMPPPASSLRDSAGRTVAVSYMRRPALTLTQDLAVKKLLVFMGTTLGSSLGWWLGGAGGIMGSFILSMVGLGAGMYFGAQLARRLEI